MINNLFDFIDRSPSAYHTVSNIAKILEDNGFTRLYEGEKWNLSSHAKHFVIKGGTSIVAFEGDLSDSPFMICASHSDFPSFKVKDTRAGVYATLSTEKYGGSIMHTWFDRPLSMAGRVVIRSGNGIESRLIDIDRDLLVIPSVAIHQMPSVNDGFSPNAEIDMRPLFSLDKSSDLLSLLARELGVDKDSIISHDLFLYAREKGKLIGCENDIILSPRLDDLECVAASLFAFLKAEAKACKVLCVFDNEEVGSATRVGAGSDFLCEVLERLCADREDYIRKIARSFMVSADNAHAKHPAHPELSDPQFAPILGAGLVIKYNANQRYATNAESGALFSEMCRSCGAKSQLFYSRADKGCGSTLGTIANSKVPVLTVDIGLPQIAMHSAVESAAVSDYMGMVDALSFFYSTKLEFSDGKIEIK